MTAIEVINTKNIILLLIIIFKNKLYQAIWYNLEWFDFDWLINLSDSNWITNVFRFK